jgi:hypothetical protein
MIGIFLAQSLGDVGTIILLSIFSLGIKTSFDPFQVKESPYIEAHLRTGNFRIIFTT